MEIFTKSAEDTQNFGREFASKLKSLPAGRQGGVVLALVGGLGSGKTTFVQGLAKGFGISDKVISPTFIIMRSYSNPEGKNLYHIDLYRLETGIQKELNNLGIEDFLGNSQNIIVIEWADRAKDLLPKDTIWIEFEGNADEERKIHIPNT